MAVLEKDLLVVTYILTNGLCLDHEHFSYFSVVENDRLVVTYVQVIFPCFDPE